jgi:hypothetical protein
MKEKCCPPIYVYKELTQVIGDNLRFYRGWTELFRLGG